MQFDQAAVAAYKEGLANYKVICEDGEAQNALLNVFQRIDADAPDSFQANSITEKVAHEIVATIVREVTEDHKNNTEPRPATAEAPTLDPTSED